MGAASSAATYGKYPRDAATMLATVSDALSVSSQDALGLIREQSASKQSCSIGQFQSIRFPESWGLDLPSLIAKRERFTKRDFAKRNPNSICAFAGSGPQQVGAVGSVTRAGCS